MAGLAELVAAMQQQTEQMLQASRQSHTEQFQFFNQMLGQQRLEFEQQASRHAAEMARQQALLAEALQKLSVASGSRQASLVDNKGVAKPQALNLKVAQTDYKVWRLKFCNWVSSSFPSAAALLKEVEEDEDTVVDQTEFERLASRHEDAERISAQVWATLISLCEGEPFDIVNNSFKGKGSGLDAFRRLNHQYDPTSATSSVSILKKLMTVERCKLTELRAKLERWEEQLRSYESRSGEVLPDGVKRVLLMEMLVDPLKTHIELNQQKFNTYQKVRDEVVSYVDLLAQQAISSGPAPMDTSVLAALGVGSAEDVATALAALVKGKGKGKGKQNEPKSTDQGGKKKFTGACNHCHKAGHKEVDCWVKHPEKKPKAKGKGKGKKLQSLEEGTERSVEAGGFDLCSAEASQAGASKGPAWHKPPEEGWTLVWLTVDSGAGASAAPPRLAPQVPVSPSAASRRGRTFKTASGQEIPDLGQKRLTAQTSEGVAVSMNFAVADVHKPLLAVSEALEKNCVVHFEKGNSYIQHPQSATKLALKEERGLFLFPVWLPPSTGGVLERPVSLSALGACSSTSGLQVDSSSRDESRGGGGGEGGSSSSSRTPPAPPFHGQARPKWGQTL